MSFQPPWQGGGIISRDSSLLDGKGWDDITLIYYYILIDPSTLIISHRSPCTCIIILLIEDTMTANRYYLCGTVTGWVLKAAMMPAAGQASPASTPGSSYNLPFCLASYAIMFLLYWLGGCLWALEWSPWCLVDSLNHWSLYPLSANKTLPVFCEQLMPWARTTHALWV